MPLRCRPAPCGSWVRVRMISQNNSSVDYRTCPIEIRVEMKSYKIIREFFINVVDASREKLLGAAAQDDEALADYQMRQ